MCMSVREREREWVCVFLRVSACLTASVGFYDLDLAASSP